MNDSDSDEKKPEDVPESVDDSTPAEQPSEPPFPKEAADLGLEPKFEKPKQPPVERVDADEEQKAGEAFDAVFDSDGDEDADAFDEINDDYDHDYPDDYDADQDSDPYEAEDSATADPLDSIAQTLEENLEGGRKRLGSDGGEMSFLEHLEDLRGTIFKSLVAFIIMAALVGSLFPYAADILQAPLDRAYGMLDREGEALKVMAIFDVISLLIQVVFFGALGLSLPFILYFVAQFVAPGLTSKEKAVLVPGLVSAFLLFIGGVLFTYFLVLPVTYAFMIKFTETFGFEEMYRASDYYSNVVWFCLGVGSLFQFPLVLVLLCYIGVISTELLIKHRRLAVVIVLVVAALITPGGDPFTLMMLAVPLYGFFELSILVGKVLERKQRAELAKSELE